MLKLYLCEWLTAKGDEVERELICESDSLLDIEDAVNDHDIEVMQNSDLFFEVDWGCGSKVFYSYRDFVSFSDILKFVLDKHNIL